MDALESFLTQLSAVRPSGDGYIARCPAHRDEDPSLSITAGENGTVLVYCHAGCATEQILNALGLEFGHLFPDPPAVDEDDRKRRDSVTVADLAQHKALPEDFLLALGVHDLPGGGVGIAYRDEEGNTLHVKTRSALDARHGSRWPKGTPLMAYGLDGLDAARRSGYLHLVEGESDVWTLRYHRRPVIGVPGARAVKVVRPEHLHGISQLYVHQEPDSGGEAFVAGLRKLLPNQGWSGEALLIRWEKVKDVSDLHRGDSARFGQDFEEALVAAEPLLERDQPLKLRSAVTVSSQSDGMSQKALLTEDEVQAARRVETSVGRFVRYAARLTDAPFEFLEAVGARVLSAIVGRKSVIRLTTGTVIPALWVMLVGDSTIFRKSTALSLGRDLITAAGLDVLAPDDFFPQRFVTLMAERSGKSTLFLRDEFLGSYEGLNKHEHQAGGKQVLIGFYDGGDYRKELQGEKHKNEDGEIRRIPELVEVKDPVLSVLAGTQRDLLLSIARTEDIFSGFLPRFAFVVPDRRRRRKDVSLVTPDTERCSSTLIAEVVSLNSTEATAMTFDSGVLKRWNQYSTDLEEAAQSAWVPSIAAPVYERHGRMALHLAALFAFSDGKVVTEGHMLSGIETADRWRLQSYTLLTTIGPTREEKMFQRVLDLVSRKPGILRRDIMSALRLTARAMDSAHETLTQRGSVRAAGAGKGTAYFPSESSPLATLERLSMCDPAAGVLEQGDPEDGDDAGSEGSIKHSSISSGETVQVRSSASLDADDREGKSSPRDVLDI